jgi:hypothetical protein
MKKLIVLTTVICAAGALLAAPATGRRTAGAGAARAKAAVDDEESGPDARVRLEQFPKLGRAATLAAPSITGGTTIGSVYTKPRQWIVLEAKYTTYDKLVDQLTFTWHVMLETKTATTKDKEAIAKRAPYSYFSQTVTYANIPKGSHAASVCLHPSYLEQYGEPKAVGLVVTDSNGKVLAGDVESEIKGIASHPKSIEHAFWNDNSVMDAKQGGEPMVERRQGLQDRSKTIWALVNPNDYELVVN